MPREKTTSNEPESLRAVVALPVVDQLVNEARERAPISGNPEVDALVRELKSAWTDPLAGKPDGGRKLTQQAAEDIVRRVGEGLDLARALAPWRITRSNLATWESKADEDRQPYEIFFRFLARAQNILRGKLITDIANSGDVKAKIELLRATTPEFAPEPAETVFNLRPQFMSAAGGRTTVNVLPELPPYEPPKEKSKS